MSKIKMASLNSAGRTYADSLISQGKVNKTASWSFNAEDGNALLGPNGDDWTNFGKHHLGVDSNEANNTKAHWKYPFAKGGTLYRSALTAIRQRASQQNDTAIFDAAGAMIEKIDGSQPGDNIRWIAPKTRGQADDKPRDPTYLKKIGFDAKVYGGEATISIYGDIGNSMWGEGVTAKEFGIALDKLPDAKVINVRFDSDGGDVFQADTMYTRLRTHGARIISHIDGHAASAASFLAMAGHQIRIAEAGFIMIHNASGAIWGGSDQMRLYADLLDRVTAKIAKIYADRTGQPLHDIEAMMAVGNGFGTWLDAEQAISQKFADAMVANLRVAANVRHPEWFPNLPQSLLPRRAAAMTRLSALKRK